MLGEGTSQHALIAGKTGSGKSTTLYATLSEINNGEEKIITIEDPVEYQLPGVLQIPVNDKKGLTFARGLRSILRHDPDKILVGEIRDGETAEMAVRAALTGHLVLSTIHTNSAWGTISRLVDMGVPPFLIASTLNTSVAQRLVRLLCTHCKKEEDFTDKRIELISFIEGITANDEFNIAKIAVNKNDFNSEYCHLLRLENK